MLTTTEKNKLVDKINMSFAAIGIKNGTTLPKGNANADPVAMEYWLATHLASLANKRKELAEKSAVLARVIIDKEKAPKPAGTMEVVYASELVHIQLEVRSAAERVDVPLFIEQLEAAGVDINTIIKAQLCATKFSRPAHVFSAALLTTD